MALYWRELLGRITGVSTPIFGISWEPTEPEISIAKDLMSYLEDRRFLYTPFENEDAGHIVASVDDSRDKMTELLERADQESEISKCLVSLRATGRNFMSRVGVSDNPVGLTLGFEYVLALGELRSSFGLQIAVISKAYGIDVPDQLVDVLPPKEIRADKSC